MMDTSPKLPAARTAGNLFKQLPNALLNTSTAKDVHPSIFSRQAFFGSSWEITAGTDSAGNVFAYSTRAISTACDRLHFIKP
jgi:hypothetical protein